MSAGSSAGGGFEEFLKKFDTNGNGMLEEDELNNTPAKSLVESVFGVVGKKPKYPVAISDILKAIDGFPGRVRVRERTDNHGKSVDVDIEPDASNPAAKEFSLESGTYHLITDSMTSAAPGPTKAGDVTPVRLVNDHDKIIITKSGQDNSPPIIGKRDGNEFAASVDGPPGKTSLKGTLTADNELSGEFTAVAKDGQLFAKGTFRLIKITPAPEPILDSTSAKPAESQPNPMHAIPPRASLRPWPFRLESGTYTFTVEGSKRGGADSAKSEKSQVGATQVEVKNDNGKITIVKVRKKTIRSLANYRATSLPPAWTSRAATRNSKARSSPRTKC